MGQKESKYTGKSTLLESGAGTGKTTYMRESIRDYLAQGGKEEDILGVTFTDKAGRQMKGELASEFKNLKISSMYSYFYQLIEYVDLVPDDFYEKFKEKAVDNLTVKLMKSKRSIKFEFMLNSWQTYCTMDLVKNGTKEQKNYLELRNRLTSVAKVEDYIKIKAKDNSELAREYRYYLEEIIRFIKTIYKLGFITYTDIILQGIFVTDNSLKFILIDEFQDLTFLEYLSIITLSKNAVYLILMDINQDIYQWRHSTATYNLRHLTAQIPDIEFKTLDTNYRCSRLVHELSTKFTGKTDIEVNREVEGKIGVLPTANYLDEILKKVKEIENTDKTLSVLCQTNQFCEVVANHLKINGVKGVSHKMRSNVSDCDPIRLFRKLLDVQVGLHSTPKLKGFITDTYLTDKYKYNTISLLNALEDITAHELIFGPWSFATTGDFPGKDEMTYVIFDLETTGLKIGEDEIIQIAALKIDSNFNEIDRLELYLQPTDWNKLKLESYEVHGITREMLESNGVPQEEGLEIFLEFIQHPMMTVLIGHNIAGFDVPMLKEYLGDRLPFNHFVVDTLDMSRVLYPHLPTHKLEDLNRTLELGANPNHNAIEDVRANAYLLKNLAEVMRRKHKMFYSSRVKGTDARKYMNKLRENEFGRWMQTDYVTMYYKILEDFESNLNVRNQVFTTLFGENLRKLQQQGYTHKEVADFLKHDTVTTDDSKIVVQTIHQSKGLEYDIVIYLQTFSGGHISEGSEATNKDYVTISRARDEFYIVPKASQSSIAREIKKILDKYKDKEETPKTPETQVISFGTEDAYSNQRTRLGEM